MAEYLELFMFAAAVLLLLLGFPVAFTLAGTALAFAFLGDYLGVIELRKLNAIPSRIFGIASNEVVVAVPLFIYMGVMLERSKVAEDLLSSMGKLFGDVRGGLAISVVLVGMLMAASTGIVGATVVTMGLLALPVMLRAGYDPKLSSGVICASGTLGQVIPPSIVLVFLGDILTYANQQANLQAGNLAGKSVGVGHLFAGSLLPGLMLVGLYLLYIMVLAWLKPAACPPMKRTAAEIEMSANEHLRMLLQALIAPAVLIVAVLGSILGGVATPTEAAGVGAVGATLLAAIKVRASLAPYLLAGVAAAILLLFMTAGLDMRIAREEIATGELLGIYASFALLVIVIAAILLACWIAYRERVLANVVQSTARITAMVFAILIGASLFSLSFRLLGGEELVHELLSQLPGGLTGAMIFVMLLMFVLGFFLDFLEIIFIIVPIVGPALILMGADPVWLGVMIAVNLQTSFLTPPFGFALFFLRGVAPPSISTQQMYRGVAPFIGLQLIGLSLVALFPGLGTWLPTVLFE